MADKTEKATPKRKEEARKKGQVARSADLGGAAVLLAGLLALGAAGPALAAHASDVMTSTLQVTAQPVSGALAKVKPPASSRSSIPRRPGR